MLTNMLSSMFQSRAAESEEQREGRLARMRDHAAEVNDDEVVRNVVEDDDGRQVQKLCTQSFDIR